MQNENEYIDLATLLGLIGTGNLVIVDCGKDCGIQVVRCRKEQDDVWYVEIASAASVLNTRDGWHEMSRTPWKNPSSVLGKLGDSIRLLRVFPGHSKEEAEEYLRQLS